MPNTIVNLSIAEKNIHGVAKMPLADLQGALHMPYNAGMQVNTPYFDNYFKQHIKAVSNGVTWQTGIDSIGMLLTTDAIVGEYSEVLVYFNLTPADNATLRKFTFDYTAIIHQVVTHKVLVYVSDDWRNGLHSNKEAVPVRVIQLDIATEKILPLQVNIAQGSWFKGFASMVQLGMEHIKEGTDHLLFLLVLLLPAMLVVNNKKWGSFGSLRQSIKHLLTIVTAFTIGHSITLIIGAFGWVNIPSQPVEILIAVSIFVSAVHALLPVFPGRETFIAAAFGLIHGMAFAAVLSNMQLSTGTLIGSILGFNIGIELMQLFIIILIVPWLIVLSKTPVYAYIRIVLAVLAGLAAIAWITERTTGNNHIITPFTNELTTAVELKAVAILALLATATYTAYRFLPRLKLLQVKLR